MTRDGSPLTYGQFLTSAALIEGGLLLAAFGCGWLTDTSPTATLSFTARDFGIGVLATLPMFALLAACFLSSAEGLRAIRTLLREMLGDFLERCRLVDLILLALLAGVCEEALFRGFLYFWIHRWNPFLAVFVVNLGFAVAHAVTPLYALLAGFMGLYLTALVAMDPTPNLLIPITAHAVYDFVGFLVVRWDHRRHESASAATADADSAT